MKNILRRIAIGGGVLAGVIVFAGAGVYLASQRHVTRQYQIAAESIPIPVDSLSIERGRHLADVIAKCGDCHGPGLSGAVVVDNAALGTIGGANLTRGKGGIGASLTDADWVRAIRHGVRHDGLPILLMPSAQYKNFTVEDLGAIIAYAKSVPPVDAESPRNHLGPVGRALMAAGKLPMFDAETEDHSAPAPTVSVVAGPTKEFGDYIIHTAGCADCHGPTLAGGRIAKGDPSWPPAANLTPTGLKAYDEAAFFTALRTGVRPGGTKIQDPPMPIAATKQMTDDEIRAVWLYLKTVQPREFGAR
jgi:mono/diheme cytochrome c family protein